MYLINEKGLHTENPVYQKLSEGSMFIPEARVAKDYFNTGFYERSYIDWAFDKFIKPDANVIDIGAHIGFYTVKFAERAKHVYSFECSPKSFNYLCANIALNKKDYQVTKYNCALSNEVGTVKYYIRDAHDGGGNGISKFDYDTIHNVPSIDVPSYKLDDFELVNVNLIKIDVEGHEKEVLQGAIKTIQNNNYPPILFESWDSDKDSNFPANQLRIELFEFIEI